MATSMFDLGNGQIGTSSFIGANANLPAPTIRPTNTGSSLGSNLFFPTTSPNSSASLPLTLFPGQTPFGAAAQATMSDLNRSISSAVNPFEIGSIKPFDFFPNVTRAIGDLNRGVTNSILSSGPLLGGSIFGGSFGAPGVRTNMMGNPIEPNPYKPTRPSMGGGGGYGGAPVDFRGMRRRTPPPALAGMSIPWTQVSDIFSQVNPSDFLVNQAKALNAPYREEFARLYPEFETGLRTGAQSAATLAQNANIVNQIANPLLAGSLPRDITQQVGRGVAQLGFSTGIGVGGRQGGLYSAMLPRSLGLTSLDLMKQGVGFLGQGADLASRSADLYGRTLDLARAGMGTTMPISPLQFAVSPASVFDAFTTQTQYNNDIINQNLMNAWMAQNS